MGPAAGLIALLRRARVFHPSGVVYWASVRRRPGPTSVVADRLPDWALVRLSGALWKGPRELPDVLGCAVRFGSEAPAAGDQDLLFATARTAFSLPLALLSTRQHDYLDNDYFAIAPFDIAGVGESFLRLRARRVAAVEGADRDERLATRVARGEASLSLEIRLTEGGPWVEMVELHLERPASVDQEKLRFSPFRAGAGITPRGFLHSMRRVPYWLGQGGREAALQLKQRGGAALPERQERQAS